jgi:hypothetical protein
MFGITLTPEQIRTAPVEVRRWLEHELAKSLGLQPYEPPAAQVKREHLVACTFEEATAVLSLIQGMFPVVNVFFELGRQGISFGQERLEALRLADILHHTRLQNIDQVIACLDVINEAFRRVTGDTAASLYALDERGDCLIATQTQESVLRVWQHAIANQGIIGAPDGADAGVFPTSATRSDGLDTSLAGMSPHDQGSDITHLPAGA